jgi:pimeloyl-ACP methyl ester carboxylesterase
MVRSLAAFFYGRRAMRAGPHNKETEMTGGDVSVVLVHGAWADGSSWSKVILALREAGVAALAAPLPLETLAGDVAALDRTLARATDRVIVVGHAYGGAALGETRSPRVRGLVYVAALAPDEGETVAENYYRGEAHPQAPELAPDEDGLIWLPGDAFASAFAQRATNQEQAVLASVQRPISPACITVPLGRPRWRELPCWYLLAEDDRMIAPGNQRFMAARMGAQVRSVAADHTPSVSAPEVVARVILEAARAVA